MNYLQHLESHCGEFTNQFETDDLLEQAVQFLQFNDSPTTDSYTISTLGLHWHTLQNEDGTQTHQELLLSFKQKRSYEDVLELLWQLTTHALETHHAFKLGEYFELPPNVFKRLNFSAIYVAKPFYFDESFHAYEGDEQTVVPFWFIPIFPSEEAFIEANGVERFNEVLYKTDDALLDLKRKPLV
ncbi:suppressor of fused domain protein [Exiguobacterium alkaliphilum]|uniref:Suppressor of fused domain protein n=1 Tax=Exiguobacterium alkaliphilum TaxID=1428684 RepID=A0ABT2L1S3_9BACL|nr:suppressor of fused domain protein [Exiguobacterium alkaliphilum]MCT4796693.1 suppressor of fused domain protein [Exiguobacterium alkaliphilum]